MRSALRTAFLLTAAVAAAVCIFTGVTLPPSPQSLGHAWPAQSVAGAYHIHTSRSDGTGTVDDVAAAARRAGLSFVILTDHGDATRAPDRPAYRHGVLVIDAVEISTAAGHLVALGLNNAAPYPLAGEARDVIDDVHRLGGTVVLAHPDSPSPDLSWRDPSARVDGIEWMNADSEWRDETRSRLVATAARALIRPAASVASLFARPERSLQRWDRASRDRPTFGLAAVDAHARGLWETEGPRRSTWLALPSYEAMFRTVVQVAQLDAPLSGDAGADTARVLDALLRGRSFSVITAYAAPATLTFWVATPAGTAHAGDRLPASSERVLWNALVPELPDARVMLLRDGQTVAAGQGSIQYTRALEPGVYRVEVFHPSGTAPWLASNPIVVEPPPTIQANGTTVSPPADELLPFTLAAVDWRFEGDPASRAAITNDGPEMKVAYALGAGPAAGQYASAASLELVHDSVDRIDFVGRADRPMRIAVQVRLRNGKGARWSRSVYLDSSPRRVAIPLSELEPIDIETSQRRIAAPLHSMLLVVDTLNARPATSGTFWIADLRFRKSR